MVVNRKIPEKTDKTVKILLEIAGGVR